MQRARYARSNASHGDRKVCGQGQRFGEEGFQAQHEFLATEQAQREEIRLDRWRRQGRLKRAHKEKSRQEGEA